MTHEVHKFLNLVLHFWVNYSCGLRKIKIYISSLSRKNKFYKIASLILKEGPTLQKLFLKVDVYRRIKCENVSKDMIIEGIFTIESELIIEIKDDKMLDV